MALGSKNIFNSDNGNTNGVLGGVSSEDFRKGLHRT